MSDSLSPSERLRLVDLINSLVPDNFEKLVHTIGAPPHLIPSNFAPQGNRSTALLQWVNSPTGCGLSVFLRVLNKVTLDASNLKSFTERITPHTTLDMVYIPKGRFMMGSPEEEIDRKDHEGPLHKVQVPSFYMGKYPVIQRQWYEVSLLERVDIELKPTPSRFKGDTLPVERVSWYEAIEFCNRLSKSTGREYRLPSEAEWEYACRSGTTTPYYFGKSISVKQANYDGHYKSTTKVWRFPPNTFGLHDMHGNVFEWCLDDWHDNYQGAPIDGSAWMSCRILTAARGGSWISSPRSCRSASLLFLNSGNRSKECGFRVCCSSPRSLP